MRKNIPVLVFVLFSISCNLPNKIDQEEMKEIEDFFSIEYVSNEYQTSILDQDEILTRKKFAKQRIEKFSIEGFKEVDEYRTLAIKKLKKTVNDKKDLDNFVKEFGHPI